MSADFIAVFEECERRRNEIAKLMMPWHKKNPNVIIVVVIFMIIMILKLILVMMMFFMKMMLMKVPVF